MLKSVETVDRPSNLIERALSHCPKRVEAGEAECLKAALTDAKMSVADLASMIPDCRVGKLCRYDYSTSDRIGYFGPTVSHYTVHWQANFDLTHPVADIGKVPVTVRQV